MPSTSANRESMSAAYSPVLTGKEASSTISALGIRKANTKAWQMLLLGVLAGIYIGIGSHLFLVAMQGGLGRVVAGGVFSVGLILIVIAGAELFTGNIIMVIGTLTQRTSPAPMLRSWLAVYLGNMAGAFLFVALIWKSGLLGQGGSPTPIGQVAADVATLKLSLTFSQAFIRGILCNILVILAIIMAIMSKDNVSKIVCCALPIMAFVASGFEHSIANMYLIPAGLLAKGAHGYELAALFKNLIPVTLGNIVGGLAILILHPNRIRQVLHLTRGKEI
jgi:formate/nitrite transporter